MHLQGSTEFLSSYRDETMASHKTNESFCDEEHVYEEFGEDDIIPPDVMMKLVQDFTNYILTNTEMDKVTLSSLHVVGEKFLEDRELQIGIDQFLKSFRKYMALSNKAKPLESCLNDVLCYLSKPEVLPFFPSYPKRPPILMHYYNKKHDLPYRIGRGVSPAAKMNEDLAGRQVCEAELEEIKKKFVVDLEKFSEDHEVTLLQRMRLEKELQAAKKKLESKGSSASKKNGQTPKEAQLSTSTGEKILSGKKRTLKMEVMDCTPKKKKELPVLKTPFDAFAESRKEKYLDLDPEAREKKLQKRWNKLDDSQREVFEKQAKGQD